MPCCPTFGAMLKFAKGFLTRWGGAGKVRELATGSALLMGAKVFGGLSGYVLAFVLAKRGGSEAVGTYELAFTFIVLLSVAARYGLDGAMVRYIGQFSAENLHGAVRWLYALSMKFAGVFSIVLGILLFAFSPWLAHTFGTGDNLVIPLKWSALAVPFFTLLNMNAETLRGFKQMLPYSILQQGSVIFLAAILFAFFGFGLNTGLIAVLCLLAATIILYIYSQFKIGSQFKSLPKAVVPPVSFSQVRQVAWPIFLSSSIFMLMSWTDTLMIGYFRDEADVGIYRIAFKISTVIAFTQFAINGIAAPMIADLYHRKDMKGLRVLIHQVGLFNFLFSVPIFLVILIAPSFLLGLFGAEFVAGRDLLLILSAGQVVFALSGPVMYILTMTKHEKAALYIMYVTAAVNLVGNAILIPLIGLQGAALATAFTTILWNVIAVIAVNRYLGVVAIPFLHKFLEKPQRD